MAVKSTRKKIQSEGRKMVFDLENAMMRLQRIDELSNNQSTVINEHLSPLFQLLETTQGFVEEFYERL